MSKGFPIVLSDSGSVPAGGIWSPDAEKMQNVYQQPVQIEEIRIMVQNNNVGAAAGASKNMLALIHMSLQAGRHALTRNFVPILTLNPREQATLETWTNTPNGLYAYWKWRLPAPMPLDVGTALIPQFKWITPSRSVLASANIDSPLTISVVLVGRSIDAMPVTARVPYVAAYQAKVGVLNSLDQDLYNPFETPFHIQRMVARVFSSAGDTDIWIAELSPNKLKMADQYGYAIVKNFTSWYNIFDPATCAWTFNRNLGPRERYFISLQDAPSLAYLPAVSLIGHREETL
jgi:hypothetical protein